MTTMATVVSSVDIKPGRRPLPRAVPRAADVPMPVETSRARVPEAEIESMRQQARALGLAEAERHIAAAIELRLSELAGQARNAETDRQAQHAQKLARLDAVLGAIEGSTEERVRGLERQAVELAFAAVCRIVGPSESRHRLVCDVVREGLARVREHSRISVRLSPDDLSAIRRDPEFQDLQARHPEVIWRPDASVEAGGCCIETDRGTLECSLATQLERLRDAWCRAQACASDASGASGD